MIYKTRHFLLSWITLILFMFIGCKGVNPTLSSGTTKKPNIILILTDDQGWADLSKPFDPNVPEAYVSFFKTPNMNQLALDGMRFTDAYSPAPLCTPTRRSIQFGMTPARQHGTEFLGEFDPSGKWSIAQAMKKADSEYQCAHFGKWGGVITGTWRDPQSQMPGHPASLGYDQHDGMSCNPTGTFYKNDWKRNITCEADDDPKRTISVTDRSIAFIREQTARKKPFYLQVSYYAIHTAFQAKKETIQRYAGLTTQEREVLKGIAPMIEEMDDGIGRLLRAVEEQGICDNTYIFFTSDNGGEPGKALDVAYVDSEKGRNHPLRFFKQTLYEGGIRVPLFVKGPGIKAGTICREPVVGYDFLPTFYEIAGGIEPLPQQIDGGSFLNVLNNKGQGKIDRPAEGLIFHRPHFDKKEIKGHSAYRKENYKLILFWTKNRNVERVELYDLNKDISEQNDLSMEMPEKTRELQMELIQYLQEVED